MRPIGFLKIDRGVFANGTLFKGTNSNDFKVFVWLFVTANFRDNVYSNIRVKRGQTITTIDKIATAVSIDTINVHRALRQLAANEYIKVIEYDNFLLITILDYEKLQNGNEV